MVYECTGKLIPAAGIPLDIGIVVNNVETFYNISLANENIPVIEKFVSISGAVKKPVTICAPVGMGINEALKMAGGITTSDYMLYVAE